MSSTERYHGWIETLTARMHSNHLLPGFSAGVIIYLVGLLLALIGRETQGPIPFASRYPGFHLAVIGISFVLIVYRFAADKIWSVLQEDEIKQSFDNTVDQYVDAWRKLFHLALNNKGSLLLASAWVIFIIWRTILHYPEPIQGFSTHPYTYHTYSLLEWYILGVFLFAMAILGTGSWNILACSFGLATMHVRIPPESVSGLRKLNTFLLAGVAAWYFCVAVSAPVLILFTPNADFLITEVLVVLNPITIVQSAIGVVLFATPQFFFHRCVLLVKNERLRKIRGLYRIHSARLLESVEHPGRTESLLRNSVIASNIGSMLELTEKWPTWLMDYSAIARLALETIVSVFATRALPYLLGIR